MWRYREPLWAKWLRGTPDDAILRKIGCPHTKPLARWNGVITVVDLLQIAPGEITNLEGIGKRRGRKINEWRAAKGLYFTIKEPNNKARYARLLRRHGKSWNFIRGLTGLSITDIHKACPPRQRESHERVKINQMLEPGEPRT